MLVLAGLQIALDSQVLNEPVQIVGMNIEYLRRLRDVSLGFFHGFRDHRLLQVIDPLVVGLADVRRWRHFQHAVGQIVGQDPSSFPSP